MTKIVRSKNAEGYIDVAVAVLIIVFLIALIISLWSMITLKQDMEYICGELIEIATVSGRIGPEVEQRFEELCDEVGFVPTLTFETKFYSASDKKVQYADVIVCNLTHKLSLPGFGGYKFPFDVTVRESGLSRVYWK